jgi:hypothetical protein
MIEGHNLVKPSVDLRKEVAKTSEIIAKIKKIHLDMLSTIEKLLISQFR